MRHRKITEHWVRTLRPKVERYQITEDNLQIEVNPSGRKVWFFIGRQQGKVRKKKLGEYPDLPVKAARESVTEFQHERNQGVKVVEDPSSLEAFVEGSFKEWCLAHRKQGEETMRRLRHTHLPQLGERKLRDLTVQDIERQKAKLLSTKKPATVKRDLGDLRRVFTKAVEWGNLRRSPASFVSDPRVEHAEKLYLSDDELRRLNDALRAWDQLSSDDEYPETRHLHPMFANYIRVIANTGMRRNEALSIEFRDIHIGKGTSEDPHTLTVRPEVSKTGRRRVIPVNQALLEHLPFIEMDWGPDIWQRFVSDHNRRLFEFRHIKRPWDRLRKMAKLEHITLHQLRHNFASQLVLKGAPPSVIQRLMGHTSIETTMLYFSVRQEDAVEAVNLL